MPFKLYQSNETVEEREINYTEKLCSYMVDIIVKNPEWTKPMNHLYFMVKSMNSLAEWVRLFEFAWKLKILPVSQPLDRVPKKLRVLTDFQGKKDFLYNYQQNVVGFYVW